MGSNFQDLENLEFITEKFEIISYKFLSCSETDIYKADIVQL